MSYENFYEEISKRYKLYVDLYDCRKEHPETFDDTRCNNVLNALMGGHKYGWRVIGITRKALEIYHASDFKHVSGNGIRRAHVTPRIDLTRKVLSASSPMTLDELVDTYRDSDVTVLCAKGQNKKFIDGWPDQGAMQIRNEWSEFFRGNALVGWRHRKEEVNLLRGLWK